ncbi:hypothetical protein ERJ75_000737000 [Trypanosoma vivax]|uniref:Chromosomal passenger protein n=1 Tax=Trypanosoma vivax (strain Y486) TaxID=1055687 RepID=G0TXD8_TRYVY|nr:hypothetical protein TRVL_07711 [Trypanosoma vivax]KAH8614115.1 hypothetical protein ERJ75_000737000 [Trypanosoma vivax]CCC48628.1 conserved hypothetical protein [Trypanosoma vivax Y486]
MSDTWSPQLVEELLFRQYMKGEDVSKALPPPPPLTADQYMTEYEQSTKVLFSYLRNGPTVTLAAQNPNNSRLYTAAAPTLKGHTGTTRVANQAQSISSVCGSESKPHVPRSPKEAENTPSATQDTTAQGCMAPPEKLVPKRLEWPQDVPTDDMIKSTSLQKRSYIVAKRVAAQETIDPDLIFKQNTEELPLKEIFKKYSDSIKSLGALRGGSGDWRDDSFTEEEEGLYKRELGFVHVGPSQCIYMQGHLA